MATKGGMFQETIARDTHAFENFEIAAYLSLLPISEAAGPPNLTGCSHR